MDDKSSSLVTFQGENKYYNANADVCIFVWVDAKLGFGKEGGGLAEALRLPALHANKSLQATLAELMQAQSDTDCAFKPQMISTLPNLLCFPPHQTPVTPNAKKSGRLVWRYIAAGTFCLEMLGY